MLAANNVAVVCAAGNGYYQYQTQGVGSPAADPNAWAVGAFGTEMPAPTTFGLAGQ